MTFIGARFGGTPDACDQKNSDDQTIQKNHMSRVGIFAKNIKTIGLT